MAMHEKLRLHAAEFALCILLLCLLLAGVQTAQAETSLQPYEESCLECHGNPALSLTLPSEELLSLYIPDSARAQSIHLQLGLSCTSCHTDIQGYPHPELAYESKRELTRAYDQLCQRCHEDNYTRAADSIHAQIAAEGNLAAPVCSDCHSAHAVTDPDAPRARISTTCGQCHSEIYAHYADSVHGSDLINQDNPDVPVCTDCHGVHDIQDPRTATFRVESPELCAGCHADPQLMAKYDLPANVYDIYRLSWHGVEVAVYKANWPTIFHESAVCTDCHGIHGILRTEDPDSMVHPDNLLTTCRQCHPSAGPNWTGAWTGHNEVSLARTPFVFYTKIFYDIFTPGVLALSGLYVLLQIMRALVERVRRSLP